MTLPSDLDIFFPDHRPQSRESTHCHKGHVLWCQPRSTARCGTSGDADRCLQDKSSQGYSRLLRLSQTADQRKTESNQTSRISVSFTREELLHEGHLRLVWESGRLSPYRTKRLLPVSQKVRLCSRKIRVGPLFRHNPRILMPL